MLCATAAGCMHAALGDVPRASAPPYLMLTASWVWCTHANKALTSTLFFIFLSLLSAKTSSAKHTAISGCTAPTSSPYSAAVT